MRERERGRGEKAYFRLKLLVITIHQSNSKYKLFSIVVIENSHEVITKCGIDLLGNLFHCQLLVCHPLSVQFKTQQPGGYACGVKIRHLIVDIDKLLVLGDNCVLGVWIIVDGCVSCDLPQSGVFQPTQHILQQTGDCVTSAII